MRIEIEFGAITGEAAEKLEEKIRSVFIEEGISAKIHDEVTGNDLSVPKSVEERRLMRENNIEVVEETEEKGGD